MISALREVRGMRGLAPLPSQVLTLGCHGSAEKDMEENVAENTEESVQMGVAERR